MTIACVFPGQGAQTPGMLADLAASHALIEDLFNEASETLGYDLWRLTQHGPEAQLNQTTHTQPALLVAGVALWRLLSELGGVKPSLMAGHSLGEYTALVCAGSIDFGDAVRLVAYRGACMQEAAPDGAMAALLGLDDAEVEEICRRAGQGSTLSAANYNAPGQVVVSGHAAAVERAVELSKAKSARARVLPVSVPSHCALMAPAAEKITDFLETLELRPPAWTVLHNVDASERDSVDAIKDALKRQLCQPVRWTQTIRRMARQKTELIIECGPGRVLTGLIKRIDSELKVSSTQSLAAMQQTLSELEQYT